MAERLADARATPPTEEDLSAAMEKPFQGSGPPIPAWYYQFQHYLPPCKCELAKQIRYYNHRTKEFYYHTAAEHAPAASQDDQQQPQQQPHLFDPLATSEEATTRIPPCSSAGNFYDPYGPYFAPGYPPYSASPHPHIGMYPGPKAYSLYPQFGISEAVLVMLALILWLYSFYRLFLVWQKTLNFSESSIQGPQGWDLLVNWVLERIRIKKLPVPGRSTKRKGPQHMLSGQGMRDAESATGNDLDEDDVEEDSFSIQPQHVSVGGSAAGLSHISVRRDSKDVKNGQVDPLGGAGCAISSTYENLPHAVLLNKDKKLSASVSNPERILPFVGQKQLKDYLLHATAATNSSFDRDGEEDIQLQTSKEIELEAVVVQL